MEHRNLIAVLCLISAFILPINAELKYVDASRLTLIGKVMPTPENVYHRVDTGKYNDMPFQVKRLFTHWSLVLRPIARRLPLVGQRREKV
mgnify:CR=1 FL=1